MKTFTTKKANAKWVTDDHILGAKPMLTSASMKDRRLGSLIYFLAISPAFCGR